MVGDHDQFECNRPLFFGIDEQHAAPSSRQSEKGKANRLAWCTSALCTFRASLRVLEKVRSGGDGIDVNACSGG